MQHENFTFFPDPQEQQRLRNMDLESMAELVARMPDMAGRFMHEWLQVKTQQIIYEALMLCRELPQLAPKIGEDITKATMMLISTYERDAEEVYSYFSKAMKLLNNAKRKSGVNGYQTKKQQEFLEEFRAVLLQVEENRRRMKNIKNNLTNI